MTSNLPAGKNHKVFADNFFTSVPLRGAFETKRNLLHIDG